MMTKQTCSFPEGISTRKRKKKKIIEPIKGMESLQLGMYENKTKYNQLLTTYVCILGLMYIQGQNLKIRPDNHLGSKKVKVL